MEKTFAIIWISPMRQQGGALEARFTEEEAELRAADLNVAHPLSIYMPVDVSLESVDDALTRAKTEVLSPSFAEVIPFAEIAGDQAGQYEEVAV